MIIVGNQCFSLFQSDTEGLNQYKFVSEWSPRFMYPRLFSKRVLAREAFARYRTSNLFPLNHDASLKMCRKSGMIVTEIAINTANAVQTTRPFYGI